MKLSKRTWLAILFFIVVLFLTKNYLKNIFTPIDKTQHSIEQGLAPIDLTPEQARNQRFSEGVHVEIRGVAENCQARVYQDGVVLFGGYLDVAESRVFEGKREVRVKVVPGNCLELSVNGSRFQKLTPSPNAIEKIYLPQSR